MDVHDQLLEHRLTSALGQVARPFGCDEGLTLEVQAGLLQLGVPCSELTPWEQLVAQLWAMKQSLSHRRSGDGPSAAPPSAA